jgi:hypothetical protein
MHISRLMLILVVASTATCYAQEAGQDTRSLGEIARELRAERKQDNAVRPKSTRITELIAEMSLNNEDEYEEQMRVLFDKQDFAGLEDAAASARSRQSRFPGGVWRLYTFYQSVSSPIGGSKAGDAAWETQLNILKRWEAAYPSSVTARVALAQAFLNFGVRARGPGFSDSVSEEGWEKLGLNTSKAEAKLQEAATLPEKCPHYYAVMLQVALNGGWSKDRTRAMFDEAMRFEPAYYHIYRLYANYLQPKWYGEPGEVEAFATEIANHIGGEEGDFVYFEIGTLLGCGNCGTASSFKSMSWPRVKNGYAALESRYGTSTLKMNRFAYLSTLSRDRESAKTVFLQIGENWNRDLWKTREKFEAARNWALNDAP